jgi:aldose 1-epimerase
MATTTIELATPTARVVIVPAAGGAIASFDVRGAPILRPTPADALAQGDVRRMACFPLVPYSNRIRHARLSFAGREFTLARNFGASPESIHGVGWQRAWHVADAGRQHLLLELVHDARGDDAHAWPWPFAAALAFRLADVEDGSVLAVTLSLRNTGDVPFPFGLGFHPFFPKHASTRVGFAADAVWQIDAAVMPVTRTPIPAPWRFDPSRDLGDVVLDNVFTGFKGTAIVDDAFASRRIDADAALAFAVVYAPEGGDFVAVEPVTHETDAFNRAAQGAQGTGTRILRPGDAFSCTMRVTARARSLKPR